MKTKKIPKRTCLGCMKEFNKNELIRVVRKTDNSVCIDFSSKLNGRGAYICPSDECLSKALKSNRISKALDVSIPEEVVERLKNEIKNG